MSLNLVRVTIKPNSKKGPLVAETSEGLLLFVREPAVDGKANEAAIKLLAEHYKVSKSKVVLKSGHASRHKTFIVG